MDRDETGPRRVYRVLLGLFPPAFRRSRGRAMEHLFVDMCRERRARTGRLGLRFWAGIGWDVVSQAAVEWAWVGRRVTGVSTGHGWEERMFSVLSDLRYAIRSVVRQPLYGTLIVLMMTLSIAGNAAVFRVFNGLFIRPLPFDQAERLVDLDERAPQWNLQYTGMAYPDFLTWRRDNRSFESMAVFTSRGVSLATDGSAEYAQVLRSSHELPEVLRFSPTLGRFYTADEDRPDGPAVAVIGNGFWEQRFGSDPGVIGQTVILNSRPYEIIGVLPPEASFLGDNAAWIPLQLDDDQGGWWLSGVGRLRPGVTPDQAYEDLLALHKGMIPDHEVNEVTFPVVSPLRARYLGEYRLGGSMLLGAVAIVLLIACANIAGLMLARSLAREREVGIRVALGAGRTRLVRQLLTESLLLAGAGGALGVVLGVYGSRSLVGRMAEQFPRWVTFDLDGRFVAFSLAVTLGAAVLFGLVPALQSATVDPQRVLQGASTRSSPTVGRRRSMNLLVGGEMALALTLLIVAGLSLRDLMQLQRIDPGFQPEGVLSYSLGLPSVRYDEDEKRQAFQDAHLSELRALPGVASVAAASSLPLSGHWGWFFQVEGAPPRGDDDPDPVVLNRVVTPGYFETMGVTLAEGRVFDEFDGREPGTRAAIVNQTFVRLFLGEGEPALGRRIRAGENSEWMTIVGVAHDVKHYGVDEPMRPGVYQPVAQLPLAQFQVAIRTAGDPTMLVASVRELLQRADPELSIADVHTMRERMDESLWTRRAAAWLIGAFSSVALLLAVAGLYGVITYTVGQRTTEISIRMALGAQKDDVVKQVIRQGMGLVLSGALLGLVGALASARVIAGVLVGVSPTDPLVYGGVTLLLLLVAALANLLPARRAAGLEPMQALRME